MSEQVERQTNLIRRFEDLKAWQEARKLAKMIYGGTRDCDLDLKRQIRRASVSIMANIAEGFSRFQVRDRKQFFITARGSLSELQSHLYVCLDQSYLSDAECAAIQEQSVLVSKLINGLIGYLMDSESRVGKGH